MKLLRISMVLAVLTAAVAWHGSAEASTLDRLIAYTPGQLAASQGIAQTRPVSYDPGPLAAAWSLYNKAIQSAHNKRASVAPNGRNVMVGQTAVLSAGARSNRSASHNLNRSWQTAAAQQAAPQRYPELTRFGGAGDPANQIVPQNYTATPARQYQYAQNYYQQSAQQSGYQSSPYNHYGNQYYGGQYYGNQSYYGGGYYSQQNCVGST